MKKIACIFLVIILSLTVAGCGRKPVIPQPDEGHDKAADRTEQPVYVGNSVDEAGYEDDDGEDEDNPAEYIGKTVYTAKDIYLLSFQCGYLSEEENPGDVPLVIENETQLEAAEMYYGLGLTENSIGEEDLWRYNTALADAFLEMKSTCPVSKYTYVVEYRSAGSGMYRYNADKLVIDEDGRLYFEVDKKSKRYNKRLQEVTDDMSGWGYLAAVPKNMFDGKTFDNVIYPESE